jgi:hypothetical protein
MIDWTFFVGYKFRSPRLYPTWIYTPAIIFNVAVRFSWILLVVRNSWLEDDNLWGVVYGIAFFEMIRRMICEFTVTNVNRVYLSVGERASQ